LLNETAFQTFLLRQCETNIVPLTVRRWWRDCCDKQIGEY